MGVYYKSVQYIATPIRFGIIIDYNLFIILVLSL